MGAFVEDGVQGLRRRLDPGSCGRESDADGQVEENVVHSRYRSVQSWLVNVAPHTNLVAGVVAVGGNVITRNGQEPDYGECGHLYWPKRQL